MARIIKKYANRRLYDTQSSSYITLDDLKELSTTGADSAITGKALLEGCFTVSEAVAVTT